MALLKVPVLVALVFVAIVSIIFINCPYHYLVLAWLLVSDQTQRNNSPSQAPIDKMMIIVRFVPLVIDHNLGYKS